MKAVLLTGAAILALTTSVPLAAQERSGQAQAEPRVMNNCVTDEIMTQTQTDLITASDVFENAPRTATSFKQETAGCVVVTLSAETLIEGDGRLLVQPFVDGEGCIPGAVFWDSGDHESFDVHTYTWTCPDVAAGRHRLRFQWQCQDLGVDPTCQWFFRTIAVFHN